METIQVTLSDEIANKLETRPCEEGFSLDIFLSKAVEQIVDKLVRFGKWMPLEKWTANSQRRTV